MIKALKRYLVFTNAEPLIFHILAIFVIILSPFSIFVFHHELQYAQSSFVIYGFILALSVLIGGFVFVFRNAVILIVIYAALTILLVDFQFDIINWWGLRVLFVAICTVAVCFILRKNIAKISLTICTVIILSTIIQNVVFERNAGFESGVPSNRDGKELPFYLHIILDGHVGYDLLAQENGRPRDVSQRIKRLFEDNQFRYVGKAYSRHSASIDAISSALNMHDMDDLEKFYGGPTDRYHLTENKYLSNLKELGYEIRIFQSSFMDYCKSIKLNIQRCHTYNTVISEKFLQKIELLEAVKITSLLYSSLSFFSEEVLKKYNQISSVLKDRGVSVPDLRQWDISVGPLSSLPVLDDIKDSLWTAQKGTVFFAHIVMPHEPYVFKPDCLVRRPVGFWHNGAHIQEKENFSNVRKFSYGLYADQLECVYKKIEEIIGVLKKKEFFEDSIIVLHGDHGSRITLNKISPANEKIITPQEYADTFSTLFAVKRPGVKPGHDPSIAALPELLRRYTADPYVDRWQNERVQPYVYLRDRSLPKGQHYKRVNLSGNEFFR